MWMAQRRAVFDSNHTLYNQVVFSCPYYCLHRSLFSKLNNNQINADFYSQINNQSAIQLVQAANQLVQSAIHTIQSATQRLNLYAFQQSSIL